MYNNIFVLTYEVTCKYHILLIILKKIKTMISTINMTEYTIDSFFANLTYY